MASLRNHMACISRLRRRRCWWCALMTPTATIFPKRIKLLEMISQPVISPQRDNSMNPSRMELARELTPNSSPPMMSQKLIPTGPP